MTKPRAPQPVRLAISLGDPAGIGPEVTVLALAPKRRRRYGAITPIVVGDLALVRRLAREIAPDLRVTRYRGQRTLAADSLAVLELETDRGALPAPGKPTAAGARAALAWFERAVDLAHAGEVDAIVTAPLSKGEVQAAGIAGFIGHTEWLAERIGAPEPVMMLANEHLRVALVTTHLALKEVPAALTAERVERTLTITERELRTRFGIAAPRLALAALNPHAGDGGAIGHEERELLLPVVEKLVGAGLRIEGPLAADTLFVRAVRGDFDAVVALYHDQGLIPLKLSGFETGVNVTLGVEVIRTSPDHGTAFELAGQRRRGKPIATAESMERALAMAARLARRARGA
ncbi:MAG: 4-hydroxythreonine-4-phosphate dehydrogenase PdxA [bacterium]